MSDSSSRRGERLVFATAKPFVVAPANPHAVVQCAAGTMAFDIEATPADEGYQGATRPDTRTAGAVIGVLDRRDMAPEGNQIRDGKSTDLPLRPRIVIFVRE